MAPTRWQPNRIPLLPPVVKGGTVGLVLTLGVVKANADD